MDDGTVPGKPNLSSVPAISISYNFTVKAEIFPVKKMIVCEWWMQKEGMILLFI